MLRMEICFMVIIKKYNILIPIYGDYVTVIVLSTANPGIHRHCIDHITEASLFENIESNPIPKETLFVQFIQYYDKTCDIIEHIY